MPARQYNFNPFSKEYEVKDSSPLTAQKQVAKMRVCLSCGDQFQSSWVGNRMCLECLNYENRLLSWNRNNQNHKEYHFEYRKELAAKKRLNKPEKKPRNLKFWIAQTREQQAESLRLRDEQVKRS